ncbi:unnamed protein product [Urochloa decumbens]|uniref:F-box domain-containing protein n=1 Tax=Urochloa decumbens TaxID=240449 RepID=A0ABC8ZTI4_9POAL
MTSRGEASSSSTAAGSADPDPAPGGMAALDELVEEFLLRFPPDDPALLFRATLVCKRWRRLISDPSFHRRYREFHRSPPMLGLLYLSLVGEGSNCFYRTSTSCPPILRQCDWEAVDSRHGRVLQKRLNELVVWNPITEDRWELPPLPRWYSEECNMAVLCAGAVDSGCDHHCCHRGPFLVVFVGTDSEMFSCVYSSEDGMWSEPTVSQHPHDYLKLLPSVLVGNALYFVLKSKTKILKYNLGTREISVIHLPPGSYDTYMHGHPVLVAMEEDSRLGVVTSDKFTLYLWLMEAVHNGAARWTRSKLADLKTLLPADALFLVRVITFVDGVRLLFVMTLKGLFSIDLKSRQTRKLLDEELDVYSVAPFMSFLIPG